MKLLDAATAPPPPADTRARAATGAPPVRGERVAIRAWSALTPFGADAETWEGLLSGRFISGHAACATVTGASRAKRLAVDAARPAVAGGIAADAAVVVGTSKGSVEDWLGVRPTPSGLADIAEQVATAFELRGARLTVSAACASGLLALVRAAMMIRAGEARQVLVVAAEASVHPLFLGSFQRLGVLAGPGDGCRPFDRNRTGFYMSEAAAALLLDAEADGVSAPGSVYLDPFAIGGDATHLTGGDPDLRTLRHLLSRVVGDRPVDLVHAHGTGTPANDGAELAAIESAVGGMVAPPHLYSHKGALGHSLGAAGLLSVVINCHAHADGVIPPNVQTRQPLETRNVLISREQVPRTVRRSIAVAAGFGGATAAVSLVSA